MESDFAVFKNVGSPHCTWMLLQSKIYECIFLSCTCFFYKEPTSRKPNNFEELVQTSGHILSLTMQQMKGMQANMTPCKTDPDIWGATVYKELKMEWKINQCREISQSRTPVQKMVERQDLFTTH